MILKLKSKIVLEGYKKLKLANFFLLKIGMQIIIILNTALL